MKTFAPFSFICAYISLVLAVPSKRDDKAKLGGFTFVNQTRLETHWAVLALPLPVKPGTWKKKDDKYTGTFVVHPDRGYNVEETIDYQARQHEISFTLKPYTDKKKLSFKDAKKTLKLTYESTLFNKDRGGTNSTGLDARAIRPTTASSPVLPIASD
ncbi:hypothetical protein DL96DRAFT_1712315 [Flagelloscypha sp. PMI_526]|nr:hypothetical protein DL96DRAFT_1712315 [Flagelloscypha sp. PMI_526]